MAVENKNLEMFYVRGITEEEADAFNQIKKIFGIVQSGKVVRKCFLEYLKLQKENEILRSEIKKSNSEVSEFKYKMGVLCEGLDILKNFKKNKQR